MFAVVDDLTDFARRLDDDFAKFRKDTEFVAKLYRDSLGKYLAERGWYVGTTLTAKRIVALADAVEHGTADTEIENALCHDVRSALTAIERAVKQQWPMRSAILADAFEAHSKGRYTLSIPAMLAQADGMSFELLKAHLFTNKGGNITKGAKEFIGDKLSERDLMSSFVGILLEKSGMRSTTKERDRKLSAGDPVSPLNRHGVMHGIDLAYATEANGLRVVSILSLLTDILEATTSQAA
jgi:hypothetical protein